MKITVSSPDGLGDFILRVPLLQALESAGHQLQILLRSPAADLAAEVFPGAERRVIAADPYHSAMRRRRNPFRPEHEAIRTFAPDLYVAALFSLNFFDEVWMEHGERGLPVAGFSTPDSFWPSGTIADARELSARFRIRVEVPSALAEIEKNRRLAAAILGREVAPAAPVLRPTEDALAAARTLLYRHGLEEGNYWVACVGTRRGLQMKDWGEDNWRLFFTNDVSREPPPVVFLGNDQEWESIERIRSDAFRSVNLAGEPPPLPVSLALAAASRGYVGRDSGVMHLAAAAGRPTFAVFGGAHWGRFLPSSGPSVVVTQAMSCRMCDFACMHERPHCVQDITLPFMAAAWRRFLAAAPGVEIFEQPETRALREATARFPADFATLAARELRAKEARARSPLLHRLFSRKALR